MSTPASIVAAQLQALLELIDRHREERCRAIMARTQDEKRNLLRAARRDARQRLHQAIEDERARTRRELDQARARLHTRRRAEAQKAAMDALREGYPQLENTVAARWRDPAARNKWIAALVTQAANALTHDRWLVQFAPAPGDVETEIRDAITQVAGNLPMELQRDSALAAGLRIAAQGACVDATTGAPARGLLADRSRVEATLVAEIRRVLEETRR